MLEVAIAYGQAQWLAPFMVPVRYIGKIDTNLEAFAERCQRIIEGPLDVEISRLGE